MKKVIKIIKQYGIHSEKDLHKLGPRFVYFLSDVCRVIANLKSSKIPASPNGLNLDLILNKTTISLLTVNRLRTLGKKLSIYSANTAIEIPKLEVDQKGKLAYDYSRLKKDKEYRSKKIKQFYRQFLSPYLVLKKCIENDMLAVIPKGFDVNSVIKDFSVDHPLTKVGKIRKSFKIEKFRKRNSLIDDRFKVIYPTRKDLISNFFESKDVFDNPSQMTLFLPYIRNVDEYTLSKIKEDYLDHLIPFYRSAEKLFQESQATDSESKLLDLMKEVDYQVRVMNNLYKSLIEKRTHKGIELSLGMSVIALSLLCPTELGQSILAAVGGTKALKGVWYLFDYNDSINQMKRSDFFIPWYINTLSQ